MMNGVLAIVLYVLTGCIIGAICYELTDEDSLLFLSPFLWPLYLPPLLAYGTHKGLHYLLHAKREKVAKVLKRMTG